MMRINSVVLAMSVLTFLAGGCTQESSAPGPVEVEIIDPVPPSAVAPATSAMTTEQSCREAARILYDQSGAAVMFNESDFTISWPAPVDGGRLNFACSLVGSQVALSRDGERQAVDLSSPATAATQQGAQ